MYIYAIHAGLRDPGQIYPLYSIYSLVVEEQSRRGAEPQTAKLQSAGPQIIIIIVIVNCSSNRNNNSTSNSNM